MAAAAASIACVAAGTRVLGAADTPASAGRPKLRKAVKFDMIKLDAPIEKKFELIKSIGFEGVEIDSPSGVNRQEAVDAKKKTGIEIHGVIDSVHWNQRLSDPDPVVRAAGM
jgi:hexulose-6-phosphate isomerase